MIVSLDCIIFAIEGFAESFVRAAMFNILPAADIVPIFAILTQLHEFNGKDTYSPTKTSDNRIAVSKATEAHSVASLSFECSLPVL